MRGAVAGLAALLAAAALAPAADGASWRLEQPPPPDGSAFPVPLGRPGDLQFFSANRGLLAVEGNAAVAQGLYAYDGRGWHQLSVVCGGSANTARIAWAGPTEFWTIAATSAEQRPAADGITLCHFRDGAVVASYAVPLDSGDPYFPMNAATCNGPSNCWFGGAFAETPTGSRRGAFHLHWDGTNLTTVYNGQGRGVSDLESFGGKVFESVFVGPAAGSLLTAQLDTPENPPALLHRVTSGGFANDPFVPRDQPNVPPDGSEMLALDGDGTNLWAVGGGAASGPAEKNDDLVVERPPLAARLVGDTFEEVPVDPAPFGPEDRFVDVAAVPGTDTAWMAVEPYNVRGVTDADAKVARVSANGTVTGVQSLPGTGAPRGTASKIACTSTTECWMVTSTGWLFHYTDGAGVPPDDDPAFHRLISARPPDARTRRIIPFSPPIDDSQQFAPPPVTVPPTETTEVPGVTLPALLGKVKAKRKGRRTLVVSFELARRARVALVARRRSKVVARTKAKELTPGRHKLSLRLNPRRWPTRISFSTRELDLPDDASSGGGSSSAPGDTVST